MRAGSLRHRVTLYDRIETRDGVGGVTVSWGNSRDRYASADQESAREWLARQGIGEKEAVKFILRYDPTFTTTSKIVWDGVDYFPEKPPRNVEGRDRMLEVLATRSKPA